MEQRKLMRHVGTTESGFRVHILLLWVMALAASPAAGDDPNTLEAARRAVRIKDYDTAIKLFSELAEEGNADA
ncbi:MAG: hypothetical protein A2Z25_22395 [Planctomycetes bacterium RBG_16_55_9]|nr:MAG: hypothetical protein A2Z25_22395 [Planctomycetes bacterium RBG_16_55_9]